MSDTQEKLWISPGGEAYPPDLYAASGVARALSGWASVTDEEVARFHEQGYLAVESAFSAEEVTTALDALYDLIDGRRPGFKGVQWEAGSGEETLSLSREERLDRVRKFWRFVDHEPRLQALAEQPGLLQVVERIVGARPVLMQDMALIKPPRLGGEKPWHQDQAYFNLALGTPVVGAWIALDEAGLENGCMHVLPGSHRRGPVVHFHRRDWQICDAEVPRGEAVAVPLQPGGCLLFHCLLHHGTPANRSPHRRRALQYHYQPAGAASITTEERLALFGSEGKDVSC